MDAAIQRRVREATDQAWREHHEADFPLLVAAAAGAGSVSWRDAAEIAMQARPGEASRVMHLLEFVAEFARELAPKSILDVQVEAPTILAAAHEGSGSARSVGLVRDERLRDAARHIALIDWRLGDPFTLLHELPPERFDLVLASPPLGMKASVAREAGDPAGRIEYADLLLWRAVDLIAAQGTVLLHTTENVLWLDRRRRCWADFAGRGLYPQAVVSVDRALWPHIGIETLLVALGREPVDELFVGRLERDTPVTTLVRNLLGRRTGRDPHLGLLTPAPAFRGWRHLMLEREIADMFGSAELRTLSEIGTVRNLTLRPDVPYAPPANSVYLPTLGFGEVRTLPPNLEGKQGYKLLEVQLDPAVAQAEYVAGFLSSPVGRRLRESVASGAHLPHLNMRGALGIRLPVPPIEAQARAVRSAVHLASMTALVGRLHDELWRRPQDAARVLTQLETGARADPVQRWLETLPYPLASILHRYAALRDPFERFDGLAHFHEATAQFGCAVLLSILHADAELLEPSRRQIRSAPGGRRALFDRADFGVWINLGRTLAKAVRERGKHEEQRQRLDDAAGPVVELMRCLVKTEFWDALDRASKVRNADAHGGVLTKAEAEARTQSLEVELGAVEQALASGFDDIDLVRADQGRLTSGIYTYPRAQRLRGAHSLFGEFELKTRIPLESDRLVFAARDAVISPILVLAPMVLVGGGTQENRNACYFFNKALGDGRFRYVSYHFEDEPAIDIHQAALQELAADLNDLRNCRPPGRG
jgi:hypothetical protein